MGAQPSGTVTLLFTDIEGSTRLLQRFGDRYLQILREQRGLLRTAFQRWRGYEVNSAGDAFLVAFARARDAVEAAIAAQKAIIAHPWPDGAVVRVRMGLHTGEPLSSDAEYVGMDVHRAARICTIGSGGQILLSDTTYALVANSLPEGVTLRDLGEHQLKDLIHPRRLFQVVAADLPSEFPPLRSLTFLTGNLPSQLTSFVDRENEIAEVKRLLATANLVTLTGPGGVGKTRLALRVAGDLLNEYPDGAWLVELADLADPALVPKTTASALGLPEQPGRSMHEILLDHVQPRTLLLVLDNCEHLLSACAQLAHALLRGCPRLRILTTSREVLGIGGETRYSVPFLSLPEPQRPPPPEKLTRYDAVQLFIERATATLPTFKVTQRNARAIAEVCRRLDGIPLAIELAAAWVNVLAVEQIVSRLDDSVRLLTGRGRTTPARHQSLQAAIDWSYGLLSNKERVLFHRVSIFAGGFGVEALEGICRGDDIEGHEVLDVLAALVNKSLVIAYVSDGQPRYRLLDTVRRYAQDRLGESGEEEILRRRHRTWFLGLAKRVSPGLAGPEQGTRLDLLDAEHDNFRAALTLSVMNRDSEGLRLATLLEQFWLIRGHLSEGRRWLEDLLAHTRAAGVDRAAALNVAGRLAAGQGDYAAAKPLHEESLAIFRELGDNSGIAAALHALGRVAERQGDYSAALKLFEQSLEIFRCLEDQHGVAVLLIDVGWTAAGEQGTFAVAGPYLEESLAISRALGDNRLTAAALNALGWVACGRGDIGTARPLFQDSVAIFRSLGDTRYMADSLRGLARLAWQEGDFEQARRLFQESLTIFHRLGERRNKALSLKGLGDVAASLGEYERARALYEESLTAARLVDNKRIVDRVLLALAKIARLQEGSNITAARDVEVPILLGEADTEPEVRPDRLL